MLAPHWLDGIIGTKLEHEDAKLIAEAVAGSREFVEAIKAGLKDKPQPGVMGPSHAQVIRRKIQDAVA